MFEMNKDIIPVPTYFTAIYFCSLSNAVHCQLTFQLDKCHAKINFPTHNEKFTKFVLTNSI
jgi:hypothetical protein